MCSSDLQGLGAWFSFFLCFFCLYLVNAANRRKAGILREGDIFILNSSIIALAEDKMGSISRTTLSLLDGSQATLPSYQNKGCVGTKD